MYVNLQIKRDDDSLSMIKRRVEEINRNRLLLLKDSQQVTGKEKASSWILEFSFYSVMLASHKKVFRRVTSRIYGE